MTDPGGIKRYKSGGAIGKVRFVVVEDRPDGALITESMR
jgi:hypothetical protein